MREVKWPENHPLMHGFSRTISMNLRLCGPSLWLSQQQPLTTWHSCSTRSPEPMIGACEKQKTFQPSSAGYLAISSLNHATCSSSTTTSCEVYCAERNLVEPRPISTVFSAIWCENCAVVLSQFSTAPSSRRYASRLASSVKNSSMPSRSWLPPTTLNFSPKPSRKSRARLKHSVVPPSREPLPVQSLDSPRSPRLTTNLPGVSASSKIFWKWLRPSKEWSRSRGSRWRSPRMATVYSSDTAAMRTSARDATRDTCDNCGANAESDTHESD